jgi:hypothetical protein
VSTSTSQDLRCPRCLAFVRAGSDWCTLCYTDLRPAPPTPEPAGSAPEPAGSAPEPAGSAPEPVADVGDHPVRPRGKHARRARSDSDPELETAAETMLAQLAAAESADPLGRLAGQVDSPGKKFALMVGGAVALTAVLFLLMVVLGALV